MDASRPASGGLDGGRGPAHHDQRGGRPGRDARGAPRAPRGAGGRRRVCLFGRSCCRIPVPTKSMKRACAPRSTGQSRTASRTSLSAIRSRGRAHLPRAQPLRHRPHADVPAVGAEHRGTRDGDDRRRDQGHADLAIDPRVRSIDASPAAASTRRAAAPSFDPGVASLRRAAASSSTGRDGRSECSDREILRLTPGKRLSSGTAPSPRHVSTRRTRRAPVTGR